MGDKDIRACVPHQPEATHCPGIYRHRRPERTVLYQAVQENIETYLSEARWEGALGQCRARLCGT
jgi:hypothetical protein